MDAAGVVDAIAPDAATDLRVGDRVMAIVIPIDPSGGAYAEYVVVDARQVVRAPAGTTHAEAATLPMNGLTARLALDVLGLAPGAWIAVTGAAGALGGYTVQLAKADGLTVVADAAPADEELVRSLGADKVVRRGPDVADHIREIVPEGVEAVVDAAVMGPRALGALRPGGQLALARSIGEPGTVPLGDTGDVIVRNVFVPEYRHAHDKLDALRVLTEEGRIALRVADEYPRTGQPTRIGVSRGWRARQARPDVLTSASTRAGSLLCRVDKNSRLGCQAPGSQFSSGSIRKRVSSAESMNHRPSTLR